MSDLNFRRDKMKNTNALKIIVRNTRLSDVTAINEIVAACYPGMPAYPPDALRAQLDHFPTGQIVIEFDDKVVGFCMSFTISEKEAFKPHTWKEITGSEIPRKENR